MGETMIGPADLARLGIARNIKDGNGNVWAVRGGKGEAIPLVSTDKGISRAVIRHGKLVANFLSTSGWAASATTATGPTLTQGYTGFNADGSVAGVVSKTGQAQMLQWGPIAAGATGTEAISISSVNLLTPNLKSLDSRTGQYYGKFMLAVYVANMAGRAPGGAPSGNIVVQLTTGAGFSNNLSVTFNANQLREGMNFLKFVMRDKTKYTQLGGTAGSGTVIPTTETHPFQITASVTGDGSNANIIDNPVTKIQIMLSSAVSNGATFYFDSIWTDFDTMAQVVLGCDAAGADLTTYALPLFQQYGWTGYVASPYRVWTGTMDAKSLTIADMSYTAANNSSMVALKTLHDAGWEIANHTLNHIRMGDQTDPSLLHYEIEQSRAWMKAQGFYRGAEFYASPQSSTSRLAETVLANKGFVLQRHAAKPNVCVTPWGVDNPAAIGASDISNSTGQTGYQKFSLIKAQLDSIIAYGDTWFPFWHVITTTCLDASGNAIPDDGTGEQITVVRPADPGYNLSITYSAFAKFLAYLKTQETAGLVRVPRGMGGFYYGRG